MAACVLVASRSPAESLDSGQPGRYGDRARGDRPLREDRRIYPGQHLAARQRAAWPPPLLADLPTRRGSGTSARHPCRWLWWARADRRRLAVLLLRGASVECAHDGGATREPRDRRRAGALPKVEDCLYRGRFWLDRLRDVADGPALRTLPQRSAASQAQAFGICEGEGAFLVHDAADRRARRGQASAATDRVGRHRPAVVLVGLSALGFRRPALCLQDAA